jgi:hypothetical protein
MKLFVALDGSVEPYVVVDRRDHVEYRQGFRPAEPVLTLARDRGFYVDDEYLDPPAGATLNERVWCARSKHVSHVHGFGPDPSSAIRDFEHKLGPTP